MRGATHTPSYTYQAALSPHSSIFHPVHDHFYFYFFEFLWPRKQLLKDLCTRLYVEIFSILLSKYVQVGLKDYLLSVWFTLEETDIIFQSGSFVLFGIHMSKTYEFLLFCIHATIWYSHFFQTSGSGVLGGSNLHFPHG